MLGAAMKSQVRVDNYGTNLSNLLCPQCNEGYLHQGMVEVYNRQEDAEQVRATIVDGSDVLSHTLPNEKSNNPSSRRTGVIIHFECEHCDDTDLKLRIAQHKGITLMDWEYDNGSNARIKS
jgi:hypothetical protein